MPDVGNIVVKGAKVNNLKNITVEIPRNEFTVITGISGSGKSSLAFDTLFAEGQRRFAESLSSYARQFLGRMNKPDVESIEGIPPAIAIEQKVNTRNPRSTVATTTEIYDYLRLIFAKIGRTYSPISGAEVKCHSENDVMAFILKSEEASSLYLLADLDWDNLKDKTETLLALKEEGYSRLYSKESGVARIDDVIKGAESGAFPSGLLLMIDRLKLPAMKDSHPVLAGAAKCHIMNGKTSKLGYIRPSPRALAKATVLCMSSANQHPETRISNALSTGLRPTV